MQPGKLSRVKEQCPPSRSPLDGCPSEPKLFQAVSSRTEVPSDGALPSRSSFRQCLPSRSSLDGALPSRSSSGRCLPEPKFLPTVSAEPKPFGRCPSEPKLFRAVSSRTEVPSDGVRQAEALWTVFAGAEAPLNGCPAEPKLFQAVSSRTEVPSDDALPSRSFSGQCPPEPKLFWTVARTTLPPSNADAINERSTSEVKACYRFVFHLSTRIHTSVKHPAPFSPDPTRRDHERPVLRDGPFVARLSCRKGSGPAGIRRHEIM